MKRFQKGKGLAHATPISQPRGSEDISIHSGQPKSTSRNPRWPEEHNVVLAELLFEQFVNGNICNGNLRKEQWSKLVVVLNRRLGTFYSESSVVIRFKNMKADFQTLYQLTNRSGWGWDEELHIPIATDELWDEIVQVISIFTLVGIIFIPIGVAVLLASHDCIPDNMNNDKIGYIQIPTSNKTFTCSSFGKRNIRWNIEMPAIVAKSISILSDAGVGMAMFSLVKTIVLASCLFVFCFEK